MVVMRRTTVALACVLFAGSVARGEDAQSIRVYTNADLEALPPLPETRTISEPRPASEDWKFVMEFIDRERSRIDDERRLRLEQRVVDTELDVMRNRRPTYGLALAPYGFYGYGYRGHGRGRGHGLTGRGNVGHRSGLLAKQPGGLIRPLHARPNTPFRGQGFGGRPSAAPRPSRGGRRR
jgi:hypothetical protein